MRASGDMIGISKALLREGPGLVVSRQQAPHPRLAAVVERHLSNPWRQPLHAPTAAAYGRLAENTAFGGGGPFILDSGCGTGESTRALAALHPDCLVLGADRSLSRLARGGAGAGFLTEGNVILLRAEAATLWRLLLRDGHTPIRHYLLYPNPWPKAAHLRRRWHGHPVFPQLLALGGEIELRCNWEVYALEFAWAAGIACGEAVAAREFAPEEPLSRFEDKYAARGHKLFRVAVSEALTAEFRRRNRVLDVGRR